MRRQYKTCENGFVPPREIAIELPSIEGEA
jgi:hypothetical protein